MAEKTLLVIAGPTASGKTSVAIALAKQLHTEIISADSRQCYRELDIGVARPSQEELQAVPHHFIASHSIFEEVTAGVFVSYAEDRLREIFETRDVAVIAGGTGLYIEALTRGLSEIPAVPPALRVEIQRTYQLQGLQWLQQEVIKLDPVFAAAGEMQNPQRLMRALEVMRHTGKSIRNFGERKRSHSYKVVNYVLDLPRQSLYERINNRVDKMFASGLLEEAKRLYDYRHLNALQTVGYQELFDHFDGRHDADTAKALIKQHTRNYAKRQLTWFRKRNEYTWVLPDASLILEDFTSGSGI